MKSSADPRSPEPRHAPRHTVGNLTTQGEACIDSVQQLKARNLAVAIVLQMPGAVLMEPR